MFWWVYAVLLTVSVSYILPLEYVQGEKDPSIGLSTIQMIRRQGYIGEEHKNIETSDGYLLTLHRIPHGKNNVRQANMPVVFLMHGLLSSSADWVNMGSQQSIAYQLADAGYDVWMGNARGNIWSRKHIIYNPENDSEFWNFSWHEIGIIDLPTMIDYVLKVTNQENIYYIGHSQGTTSFFVMCSEKPEYNNKIRLMCALAPVAYLFHSQNILFKTLSAYYNVIETIAGLLGTHEFMPIDGLLAKMGQELCVDGSPFEELCHGLIFSMSGWESNLVNRTMIPVITSNAPAGASTKQVLHYAQEIISGKFRQYDYGTKQNIIKYGSSSPPDYTLGHVTAPVALIYSANDMLTAEADVKLLAKGLPHVVESYLVPYPKFNHLDFMYAMNARELVYNHILKLFEKY